MFRGTTPLTPRTPCVTPLRSAATALLWPIVVRESSRNGAQLSPVNRFHFAATVIPLIEGHVRLIRQARLNQDPKAQSIYEESVRESRNQVARALLGFRAFNTIDEVIDRFESLCAETNKS